MEGEGDKVILEVEYLELFGVGVNSFLCFFGIEGIIVFEYSYLCL